MKGYIPKKRYPSWGALIYTVVGPPAKYANHRVFWFHLSQFSTEIVIYLLLREREKLGIYAFSGWR